LSLHEPKMPTNIESDTPGGCQVILDKVDAFLKQYDEIEK